LIVVSVAPEGMKLPIACACEMGFAFFMISSRPFVLDSSLQKRSSGKNDRRQIGQRVFPI